VSRGTSGEAVGRLGEEKVGVTAGIITYRGERTSHPKGGDSTIQREEGKIDGGTARAKRERQKT